MSTLGRKVMDKVARKVVGRVLGLAVAGLLCAAGPAAAQSPAFTPSDEKPEDYPAGARTRRHVLCLHAVPRLQGRGAAGPVAAAMGRYPRLDDRSGTPCRGPATPTARSCSTISRRRSRRARRRAAGKTRFRRGDGRRRVGWAVSAFTSAPETGVYALNVFDPAITSGGVSASMAHSPYAAPRSVGGPVSSRCGPSVRVPKRPERNRLRWRA